MEDPACQAYMQSDIYMMAQHLLFLCANKVMQGEATMVINNENKLKLHEGHFIIPEFNLIIH